MHDSHRRPTLRLLSAPLLVIALNCCAKPAAPSKSVTLSWQAPTQNADGTPLGQIAGYHIYAGKDPKRLVLRGGITGTASTTYLITGLESGTYYFAVSAYTESGAESAQSSVASKTL
jgi:fibronectin type III domain protein